MVQRAALTARPFCAHRPPASGVEDGPASCEWRLTSSPSAGPCLLLRRTLRLCISSVIVLRPRTLTVYVRFALLALWNVGEL